jgi:hypothetical protein
MKKILIGTLVCVNVALLVTLILGYGAGPAKAQVVGGGADYLMVTGHIMGDADGVYIIDLAKRRLAAWKFDKTNKRLVAFRGHELKRDFGREEK